MTARPDCAGQATAPLLQLEGIGKSFGEARVLDGVDLAIRPGEVVGLLGENGAGKSTLMNIVAGALVADEGEMRFDGTPRRFASIAEGIAAGVAFVHQELSVVGSLDVAENLFLGRMPTRRGMVDRRRMREAATGILAEVGAGHIPPSASARSLRVGEQQLVEIARAAARAPRLLILDEPTSSLTPHEVAGFTDWVRRARADGTAIIFITHRLEEALGLCDRLVVLRGGTIVSDRTPDQTTREDIIADMTGKPALFSTAERPPPADETILSLEEVHDRENLRDVSLEVRRGEILGLFGLVGAGRTELLEVIFGERPVSAGTMRLFCRPHAPANPHEGRAAGLALVPEGRKTAGILPQHDIRRNATAASLPAYSRVGLVDGRAEAQAAGERLRTLRVRMTHDRQRITDLSGGNQQKVIFARALLSKPRLLLLDEPTHGVDVGAKEEIYGIVRAAAEAGMTVIVASSEIPEVRALCDRVAVISKGRVAGVVEGEDMTEARMLNLAFSGHDETAPA